MASLLDRLKGIENPPENGPENQDGIPDTIPSEWSADFAPDPVPGKATKASRTPLTPKTYGPVTATLKKRIEAEVAMYIEFAALPLVMRDPVCGGALHEQAEPIAKAITQILSRYPDIAHKFLATGSMGDWIKLAVALQPVGKTIWEHHVTKPQRPEVMTNDDFDLDSFPAYRPGE